MLTKEWCLTHMPRGAQDGGVDPLAWRSPLLPPLPQLLSGLLQLRLCPPSSVPVRVQQQLRLCQLEPPHLGDVGHPLVPSQRVGLGTAEERHRLSPVFSSPA